MGFQCLSCGKALAIDSEQCPYCLSSTTPATPGLKQGFYCSECGQTVSGDAKKCPCCSVVFQGEVSPIVKAKSGIFDFNGRIGRLSYFWIWFVALIISVPATFFMRISEINGGGFWLVLLMMLPFVYVAFAASVKRFHDLGKDGWWYLTVLVPIVNFFVQIYLLFFKGEEGVNRFGPPPSGIGKKPAPVISQYAQAVQAPKAANAAPVRAALSQDEMLSDDVLYEQIGVELESNNVDKAVWTRAFAMAEGDEKKTRVTYINLRFQKLKEQSLTTSSIVTKVSSERFADAPAPKHEAKVDMPPDPKKIEELSQSSDARVFLDSVRKGETLNVAKMLDKNRLFAHVCEPNGDTPLHISALTRNKELAQMLINAGAPLNQENSFNESARSCLHANGMESELTIIDSDNPHGCFAHATKLI